MSRDASRSNIKATIKQIQIHVIQWLARVGTPPRYQKYIETQTPQKTGRFAAVLLKQAMTAVDHKAGVMTEHTNLHSGLVICSSSTDPRPPVPLPRRS